MDSRDTKSDHLGPSMDHAQPCNSFTFCRLGIHHLHFTFSRPFQRLGYPGTMIRTRGPPWTLMDQQLDSKMEPVRLILGDPCPKMSLQGRFKVPIGEIFLDRPLDNRKI